VVVLYYLGHVLISDSDVNDVAHHSRKRAVRRLTARAIWRVGPLCRRLMFAWSKRRALCVVRPSASTHSTTSWMHREPTDAAAAVASVRSKYFLIRGRPT